MWPTDMTLQNKKTPKTFAATLVPLMKACMWNQYAPYANVGMRTFSLCGVVSNSGASYEGLHVEPVYSLCQGGHAYF